MSYTYNPLLFSGLQQTPGALAYNGYKTPVSTASALPVVGNSPGDARVTLDTDHIWIWDGVTVRWVDTGLTQTNIGSTPNTAGYSLILDNSSANLSYRDLILEPADSTHPGIVTAGTQTIGGAKTFQNTVNLASISPSLPLHTNISNNVIAAAINLNSTDVTSVLPIVNGGTNSSTVLNNNRVIVSSSGAIVENASVAANQALVSNSNGLPAASVTTATELSYVSGVTSAIQTQLNSKASTALNNLSGTAVNVAINMNSHQINNVSDPTSAQDAMTLNYATTTYIPLTQKAAANGVATLDASSKIPVSQLPSVVLEYQGAWNPSTNTPTLSDGTGTNGFVYYVSTAFSGTVAGLTDPSMTNFQIGDLVIYSSSVGKWQLSSPAAGVRSVNGAQGVVTVNAINQLTGDVAAGPASQSQSVVATIQSGAITPTKLGTVTDNITLDQLGASSTLEVKTGGITNTQINNLAAIARTKLASGTAYAWETNNVNGVLQDTSVTANRAVSTDTNGLPVASATTSVELGYVSGVTSAIQTQLNGKANLTLSNLNSPTAINQDLLPLTNNIYNIGNTSDNWLAGYFDTVFSPQINPSVTGNAITVSTLNNASGNSGAINVHSGNSTAVNGNSGDVQIFVGSPGSGGVSGQIQLNGRQINMSNNPVVNIANPVNPQDAVTLNYLQSNYDAGSLGDISQTSFSLSNNQSSAVNVIGLAFANASIRSAQIQYSITINATSSLYEEGLIELVQKSASWDWSQKANFDNSNVIFSVTNSGQIQYTTPNYIGFSSAKLQFRALVTNV